MAEAAIDGGTRQQVVELWNTAAPARTDAVGRLLAAGDVRGGHRKCDARGTLSFSLADRVAARRRMIPLAADIRELRALDSAEVSEQADFARLGHAQADADELVPPGAAEPANFSHADGLFEPHHGRELGIEHCSTGPGWRMRLACHAAATECADSGVDEQVVERIFASHLEDWPALLRSLAHGGR